MDPIANIEEQKQLHARKRALTKEEEQRLYDLKEALVGWRDRGGFIPDISGLDFSPFGYDPLSF